MTSIIQVLLPDRFIGRGNAKAQQCSMKLVEIGPRMQMELFKVERNVFEGDVMYHKYEAKTESEVKTLKQKSEQQKSLKIQRRKIQEENVKRKRELLEVAKTAKKAKFQKVYEAQEKEDSDEDSY